MSFFEFKSIKRIFKSLSLSDHIKKTSYRPGAPQPLHPDYGIFADLPIVPEVSDSFVKELSSFTTEVIFEITEGTTNLVNGDDTCLTTERDQRFVLKSIFDRQRHSRSLFPRDANDRYREENDLRGAISDSTRSESSIPNYYASQYDEPPKLPSQYNKTHLDLPRSNPHEPFDLSSPVRSPSDDIADASFFANPGRSKQVSAHTRVVSTSSATTADMSCLIHDQSELLSEDGNRDEDDTLGTRGSFGGDDVFDVLPATANEANGLAGDYSLISDPSSLTHAESKTLPADSCGINATTHQPQYAAHPVARKAVPASTRKTPSTCFRPSPLAQSWDADTILETNGHRVIGSLARAAAAIGTQSPARATPTSLSNSRPFKSPRPASFPNFIPVRCPSGLPQHTSWQKASSFCSKHAPKALWYDSIMSRINGKVAARAKSWRTKEEQDKWWRKYLAEREEKIGRQPWDVEENEAESGEDDDDGTLGTIGRRMKQKQLVRNRLYANNNLTGYSTLLTPPRQQPIGNGPYIDRLATIEAALDAHIQAEVDTETEPSYSICTRLLQENISLKQQLTAANAATAAAAEQDRIQRLERVRCEMICVQRELTLVENELCDPYADDGASAAMLNMCKLVSCYDVRSGGGDAVDEGLEDAHCVEVEKDSIHNASNDSIDTDDNDDSDESTLSSTSTTLWAPSTSTTTRTTRMQHLRTEQMQLFAQEHELRNAAPDRMTEAFFEAQETGFGARTRVPGDVWVDYREKYTYGSCPVRVDGGYDEDEVRMIRREWYKARRGRFGVVM